MFENIYHKFKLQNIVGKFIYANVGVYIIVVLIGVFSVLFNVADTGRVFVRFFEFPAPPYYESKTHASVHPASSL